MSGLRGRLGRRKKASGEEAEESVEADGDEGGGEEPKVVLYRCPTPTNFLCPCGAAERRLRKLEIPHRVERVPYKRKRRPEITELTGQQRVPMLIDGPEIIHDSKRILEYLEWRNGGEQAEAAAGSGDGPEGSEQSA